MKFFVYSLFFLLAAPAFADSYKMNYVNGNIYSEKPALSAKETCSKSVQVAKAEITKRCDFIEGKITSWEITLNPNPKEKVTYCSIGVSAMCNAHL